MLECDPLVSLMLCLLLPPPLLLLLLQIKYFTLRNGRDKVSHSPAGVNANLCTFFHQHHLQQSLRVLQL
jgi:hypothetical protein